LLLDQPSGKFYKTKINERNAAIPRHHHSNGITYKKQLRQGIFGLNRKKVAFYSGLFSAGVDSRLCQPDSMRDSYDSAK